MAKGLFEILREKTARKKIPIVSHFDLTYRCNLRCVHCYVIPEDRSELTNFEIKGILDQLVGAGTLYLTFSGGEILTREDFFEIASYARKLNFALRLLTNGTLIDEEIADKISSLNPELVGISIYSTDPSTHDRITGHAGSLEKSISGLKMLRERKVKVKISTVIMKQNVEDYHSVYKLAKKIGAEFQADYRIAPKNDRGSYPLRFHIGENDLSRVVSDPIFLRGSEPEPEEAYSGVFNIIPCGAGHMSCYISPYGDVYPCVQLPIFCGNLKQKPFIDIWERSDEMQNVRSITISKLLVCSKCDLLKYCRLCIGLSYLEEENMLLPLKRACTEARVMKKLGKERR